MEPNTSDQYSATNSVSATSQIFHAGLLPTPNVALLTSDGVLFYVHLETMRQRWPEAFQSFLITSSDQGDVILLDCPSEDLNIILHALSNMSMGSYQPEPAVVEAAIDRMPHLGITVCRLIHPECPLYQYILSYTPLQPVSVYAMAAHYGIHDLAVYASSYLLDLDPESVSDKLAEWMGARYFIKLISLRVVRGRVLKEALLHGPLAHPATEIDTCSFADQQKAKRVWAFFCANPKWYSDPSESC